MLNVLIIIILLAICLASMLIIPSLMTKRAMRQVIRLLKKCGAVDPANARTITELHLNPPSFRERLMRVRDYKPKALDFLISLKIVLYSEDGRIYLSEKNLLSSTIVQRWPSLAKDVGPR